jgi:hypothetical protein
MFCRGDGPSSRRMFIQCDVLIGGLRRRQRRRKLNLLQLLERVEPAVFPERLGGVMFFSSSHRIPKLFQGTTAPSAGCRRRFLSTVRTEQLEKLSTMGENNPSMDLV